MIGGLEEVRTALIDQGKLLFVEDSLVVMFLTEGTLVMGWSIAIGLFTQGRFPTPVSVRFAESLMFRAHGSCLPLFESL